MSGKGRYSTYGGAEYEKRLRVYLRAYETPRRKASSLETCVAHGQFHRNDTKATIQVAANNVVYISKVLVQTTEITHCSQRSSQITIKDVTDPWIFGYNKQPLRPRRNSFHVCGNKHRLEDRFNPCPPKDCGFKDENEWQLRRCNSMDSDESGCLNQTSVSPQTHHSSDGLIKNILNCKDFGKRKDKKASKVSFCEMVKVANFYSEVSDDSDEEEDDCDRREWREVMLEHSEQLKTDSFYVTWQCCDAKAENSMNETHVSVSEVKEIDICNQQDDSSISTRDSLIFQSLPTEAKQRVAVTAPFTLMFNISQAHHTGSPRVSARLTPMRSHRPHQHFNSRMADSKRPLCGWAGYGIQDNTGNDSSFEKLWSKVRQHIQDEEVKEENRGAIAMDKPVNRKGSLQLMHISEKLTKGQGRRWSTQSLALGNWH